MKTFRYILVLFWCVFSLSVFAQKASDLYFYQDGKTIVLTYSLDQVADVSVQVSTDGGTTYSAPLKHVSGDVGKNVQPGKKRIVWDVLAEYEKLVSEKVMFKLTAGGSKRSFTVNGVTFNMIQVKGGTFVMGAGAGEKGEVYNERPAHQVSLREYYIGETEVTQALWEAVMGNNPSRYKGSKNLPVECVSWNDCQAFVRKLSTLTGKKFRLPTEAEWEYAARGGHKSKGYKYSGSNSLYDVAWFTETTNDKGTKIVATKRSNELGIYDMSGNVHEWCSDWYKYSYYTESPRTNPQGPSSGNLRVIRGGCWMNTMWYCRVSCRKAEGMATRDQYYGLRLVLVP